MLMSRFVIAGNDGTYIKQELGNGTNSYRPVTKIEMATTWRQKQKAENVLISSLNKNLRGRYHVELLESTNNFAMTSAKQQAMIDIGNTVIDEGRLDKLAADIDSFASFVSETETRRGQLSNSLSTIDQEICDIYHYIEFGKFNAYQGWLIVKMLQSKFKQRRKVKNEMLVLQKLMDCKVNSSMIDTMKRIMEEVDGLDYKPRVLSQLFQ